MHNVTEQRRSVATAPPVKIQRVAPNRIFFQGLLLAVSIPAAIIAFVLMIPIHVAGLFQK